MVISSQPTGLILKFCTSITNVFALFIACYKKAWLALIPIYYCCIMTDSQLLDILVARDIAYLSNGNRNYTCLLHHIVFGEYLNVKASAARRLDNRSFIPSSSFVTQPEIEVHLLTAVERWVRLYTFLARHPDYRGSIEIANICQDSSVKDTASICGSESILLQEIFGNMKDLPDLFNHLLDHLPDRSAFQQGDSKIVHPGRSL